MKLNAKRAVAGGLLALAILVVFASSSGLLNDSSLSPAVTFRDRGASQVAPSSADGGREVLDLVSGAFEAAAAEVNPSVVPIFSEATVTVRSPFGPPNDALRDFFGDEFLKRWFGGAGGEQEQAVRASGSGVIVSEDGYILTNHHVVEGADMLTVVLDDGERTSAKIVGTDPLTDLALVKVDASGLEAAELGDSDSLHVGQWVIAVGNPFQLTHTTTAGIVSARGRSSIGIAEYEDFIQTDAAINPGNSGGALADLEGRVVGINSAISSPTGVSVGLGFAIPINMAKGVMEQLRSRGTVVRGHLGLVLQPLTPALADAMGLQDTRGVLVGDVESGTPAERAGFRRGDVVTELMGREVTDVADLRERVAATSPGTRVRFRVIRRGREETLQATLDELQSNQSPPTRTQPDRSTTTPMGLSVRTLTDDIAGRLGYEGLKGALIVDVRPGTPADDAGIRSGDLILEAGGEDVASAEELTDRLAALASGDALALLVRRGTNTFYVAIRAR